MEVTMKLKIEMDVTEAQAITLREMFNYWNRLAGIGSSRYVAFYVDGDGDFHPNITMDFSEELTKLSDGDLVLAQKDPKRFKASEGDRFYDYDPIGWALYRVNFPQYFDLNPSPDKIISTGGYPPHLIQGGKSEVPPKMRPKSEP